MITNLIGEEEKVRTLVRNLADAFSQAAQLKADGMRVNDVEVDITNNKLTVDADYDTK